MAIDQKTNALPELRQRNYLARDFESLRATLLNYARQYYPNQIQDFSDASVGGLFLDLAAYVGDNMSFYLDHLYNELNYDTAVEPQNIQRALVSAGIPINGATPAVVKVTIFLEVPVKNPGDEGPDVNLLPILQEGSVFQSSNGVNFNLLEDVSFAYSANGDDSYVLNPKAEKRIGRVRTDGKVVSYYLSLEGVCVSGDETTETFYFGDFVQFRSINLTNPSVTEIVKVYDDIGNTYYEVGSLTHDVVYRNFSNGNGDSNLVKDVMKVIPAPYRFVKSTDLSTRKTVLTFGGGSASSLQDDIIPDPSEFAIAFPYSKTISRVPVNPEKLLTTTTLGVTGVNTTLTVIYRSGGGLHHNVAPGAIGTLLVPKLVFPKNPSNVDALKIRRTIEVSNLERAAGGEDPLTSDELVSLIPLMKNSQERIVTKEDLLARIYTMPANFGRVFRAAITTNKHNPLSTQLHIISRDNNNNLTISSDTLKLNIKKYLNTYRMISDAIDVLDAQVVNLQLKFSIVIDPTLNRSSVLAAILSKLQDQFSIKKFFINQPIIISDVVNSIFTVQGVIAVDKVQFTNIAGMYNNRSYSDVIFDVNAYTKRQMIFPPAGGIFEIRYPDVDIIAKVVT